MQLLNDSAALRDIFVMHPLLLNGICFFLYTLVLLMLLRQKTHTFPAIEGWHIIGGEKGKENGKAQI